MFTNATTTSSAVNSAVKTMMQEVADNGMEPELALANLKQTVGTNVSGLGQGGDGASASALPRSRVPARARRKET